MLKDPITVFIVHQRALYPECDAVCLSVRPSVRLSHRDVSK